MADVQRGQVQTRSAAAVRGPWWMGRRGYFFFGAFGFDFAVFAAFLKSCALGASLLLGFRGFLPAARRLRMFS